MKVYLQNIYDVGGDLPAYYRRNRYTPDFTFERDEADELTPAEAAAMLANSEWYLDMFNADGIGVED